jgi:hypothetical protein
MVKMPVPTNFFPGIPEFTYDFKTSYINCNSSTLYQPCMDVQGVSLSATGNLDGPGDFFFSTFIKFSKCRTIRIPVSPEPEQKCRAGTSPVPK